MVTKSLFPEVKIIVLLAVVLTISIAEVDAKPPSIDLPFLELESPMIEFAKLKLQTQLESSRTKSNVPNSPSKVHSIRLVNDSTITEQGFAIQLVGQTLVIKASDQHGFMYCLLEIQEQLSFGLKLENIAAVQLPHFKKRGLKFNIPLDARTPSYDDTGDAAQFNITTVWEFDFWKEYLDQMAQNRYNQLTLWNPQPFTSMVKSKKYPELALQDVYQSTQSLNARIGVWGEAGGVTPLVLNNLEKVKTISIDEKIEFWRKVMSYAKSRGIDVHLITWAIYTNGIDKSTGIDEKMDNLETVAFFRESVKELILTYPDLKGVGITAGERMPADGQVKNWTREKWLWETYGLGLQDAKQINPEREVDFIHRFWYSGYQEIEKYWGDYPDHFSFSFKYIMARLYSSPAKSHIAKNVIPIIRESKLKTWWNLRNDDVFVYRWGDPEYVKSFYENMPTDISEGIHMGSDGYVWGKSHADKNIEEHNKLEINKHWYRFMIWGRLAYNLELDRTFFVNQLQLRFPNSDAEK